MNYAMAALIVIVTLGDIITTRMILNKPGGYEAAQFAAWMISKVGFPGLVLWKLALGAVACLLLVWWNVWWMNAMAVIPTAVVGYAFVMNTILLKKYG